MAIAQANSLLSKAIVSQGGRNRYPKELREVVKNLNSRGKMSVSEITEALPLSRSYIQNCVYRQTSKKSKKGKGPSFKKISLEDKATNPKNIKKALWNDFSWILIAITVGLAVMLTLQFLTLASVLFLR